MKATRPAAIGFEGAAIGDYFATNSEYKRGIRDDKKLREPTRERRLARLDELGPRILLLAVNENVELPSEIRRHEEIMGLEIEPHSL